MRLFLLRTEKCLCNDQRFWVSTDVDPALFQVAVGFGFECGDIPYSKCSCFVQDAFCMMLCR